MATFVSIHRRQNEKENENLSILAKSCLSAEEMKKHSKHSIQLSSLFYRFFLAKNDTVPRDPLHRCCRRSIEILDGIERKHFRRDCFRYFIHLPFTILLLLFLRFVRSLSLQFGLEM